MITLILGIVVWAIGYRMQVSAAELVLRNPGAVNPIGERRVSVGFVVTLIGFALTVIGAINWLS